MSSNKRRKNKPNNKRPIQEAKKATTNKTDSETAATPKNAETKPAAAEKSKDTKPAAAQKSTDTKPAEIHEEPADYDVFLCCMEKDPEGRPTEDSELADELYQHLTEEGFSVCLPHISLKKYSDSEKQRYISAALDSAGAMIVIGTKPAYFEASPVKKQWTDFLSLAEKSISQKTLIPAYRGMSRDELPEEFSDLKAGNMSKMSFLQDILRAVKGSLQKSDSGKAKTKKSENITVDQKTRPASGAEELLRPMLKRVHMCLEDGNWEKADAICEQALNMDPENAQAYLGKLMAELHVHKWEELKNCRSPFDSSDNYRKAVRFGDEKLSDELKKCAAAVKDQNAEVMYNNALSIMESSEDHKRLKKAGEMFRTISGYKDSEELSKQCFEKSETLRKDSIYEAAVGYMKLDNTTGYGLAINSFKSIPGWKDADEQTDICKKRIEEIHLVEKRMESEMIADERRTALTKSIKASKRRKKFLAVFIPVVAAAIIVAVLSVTVFIPSIKYSSAMALYNADNYYGAYQIFNTLNFNDSADKAADCLYLIQKNNLKNVEVGSTVKFGFYEQDNNPENNAEEIEWLVLDMKGKNALLISKYVLDSHQFNSNRVDTTWEKSSLRKWLNGSFYKKVFTKKQQELILNTSVPADKNPVYDSEAGKSTKDKIFLFSISEVNTYYPLETDRRCYSTDYAKANGVKTRAGTNTCWWLLRTAGKTDDSVSLITSTGAIDYEGIGVSYKTDGIRPVMWVKTE